MKKLLVVCGLMTAMIGIVCISSITMGQSYQPVDLVSAAGLSYCHTQICFRGIALGTDWYTAMAKLTPNVDEFRRYAIQVNTTDAVYNMTPLDSDQTLVGQIEVGPTIGFGLHLGDIVGQYGAPCLVSYLTSVSGFVQLILIYPQFDVVTPRFHVTGSTGFWTLDPGMSVVYADFYVSSGGCATPDQYPTNVQSVAWHGFARFRLN